MPRLERSGLVIGSAYDLQHITHHHEREYARYLGVKENIQVKYEAWEFQVETVKKGTGERRLISHVPDFQVIDLEEGKDYIVELTTSPFVSGFYDPKARQKGIMELFMEESGESIIYMVLYQQNLRQLQQDFPELGLDFFKRTNGHQLF